MIRERIMALAEWATRLLTQPRSELDRWQRSALFAYELGRHGAEQLRRDRASELAAALAYRTLFGLLPIAVVGTILVRAVKGADEFSASIRTMIESAGLFEIKLAEGEGSKSETLGHWIQDQLSLAGSLDLKTLGFVGVIVVIYSAISLMVTVEKSFNLIFRAPGGRAWSRRVPLYWTILTISPVIIGVMLYLDSTFRGWFQVEWNWLLVTANLMWSFLLTWLLLFAVFYLIPNTIVQVRAAIAGAFVSALFLEVSKRGIVAYLENALTFKALYSSLGLIPLFMVWVYFLWWIVLFGLQVGATLQALQGSRRFHKEEFVTARDSWGPLRVLLAVGARFMRGEGAKRSDLAKEAVLDENQVGEALEDLQERGWVVNIRGEEDRWTLGCPPSTIPLKDVLAVTGGTGRSKSAYVEHLWGVQLSEVDGKTLEEALKVENRNLEGA